jgi:hypothetical protein
MVEDHARNGISRFVTVRGTKLYAESNIDMS